MTTAALRRRSSRNGMAGAVGGPFLALSTVIVATFLLGGSARGDVATLMILRPLAVAALAYGSWTLRGEHLRRHRLLVAFALALVALPLVHLLPLPFSLWSSLPGRDVVVAIDRLAGLGEIARPLSLAPAATANALFSLVVPLAVFILAIQLDRSERERLLPVLLACALLSAVLAAVQVASGKISALYIYDITNFGSAVGLFANRNHQACLLSLCFPMLGLWASRPGRSIGMGLHLRRIAAVCAASIVLPLVLVTGSRAGLIASAAGIVATAALFAAWSPDPSSSHPSRRWSPRARLAVLTGVLILAAVLVGVTVVLGHAEAWERLTASDAGDLRFRALPAIVAAIWRYWPAGSGIGSFEKVYQVNEPDALLAPQILNHAHNDWSEVVLTGGLPAVALLVITVTAVIVAIVRLIRAGRGADPFAQLGAIVIVLAGIVSTTDYPLRTPALQAIFVVATVWLACASPRQRSLGALGGESAPLSGASTKH